MLQEGEQSWHGGKCGSVLPGSTPGPASTLQDGQVLPIDRKGGRAARYSYSIYLATYSTQETH